MEYPANDTEFYDLMKKRTKEVEEMDISEDWKKSLYSQIEKTIQRHEENKRIEKENRRLVGEIKNELIEMEKTKENIFRSIRETRKNFDNINSVLSAVKIIYETRN